MTIPHCSVSISRRQRSSQPTESSRDQLGRLRKTSPMVGQTRTAREKGSNVQGTEDQGTFGRDPASFTSRLAMCGTRCCWRCSIGYRLAARVFGRARLSPSLAPPSPARCALPPFGVAAADSGVGCQVVQVCHAMPTHCGDGSEAVRNRPWCGASAKIAAHLTTARPPPCRA